MTAAGITAEKLNRWIVEKEPLFILDTRNEEDFEEWKIDGENIEFLNVPYFELLEDGIESILDKLPKDKKIIAVCAKEGSSKLIAEQLSEAGVEVSYLLGGMKKWRTSLSRQSVSR